MTRGPSAYQCHLIVVDGVAVRVRTSGRQSPTAADIDAIRDVIAALHAHKAAHLATHVPPHPPAG